MYKFYEKFLITTVGLCSVNYILVRCQKEPLLSIKNGKIKGTINRTIGENKTYYAFKGIPFAKPPLDELRFKSPERADNWSGVLDATQDKDSCVQGLFVVGGSEDCLFINVYTPSLTERNIPIMVWIYGGAYIYGGSSYALYGPDYLLEEDVIFVSFNYRLGVFGFLSTEDLSCAGNWGLKDQVLALRWVQENIEYFGGNPKKVTIFGQSAGAASVSYLLQIPQANGLFQAAIMNSGSSLCLLGFNRHPKAIAFKLGRSLRVNTTNSVQLTNDLRKIDYRKLQRVSTIVGALDYVKNPLAGVYFAPVLEPLHETAVFYKRSHESLCNGNFHRVSILSGVTSVKAAVLGDLIYRLPILMVLTKLYIFARYGLNNKELLAPADLSKNKNWRRDAGQLIKSYYFGNLPIKLKAVMHFFSDDQFNRPVREEALRLSKYVDVYFYVFSYEGKLGSLLGRNDKATGHLEELGYLFRTNFMVKLSYYSNILQGIWLTKLWNMLEKFYFSKFEQSRADLLTQKRMVKLWTNFAKYRNPTPTKDNLLQNVKWPTVSSNRSDLAYLDIGTNLELRMNPFKLNMEFYDTVYKNFGSPPYDTY